MLDSLGRTIDYVRVSVTDRCNLRCSYCMPHEGVESLSHDEILKFEEILRVCTVMTSMGVKKIKVTGGEPLVRKGICDFIKMAKGIPGIEQVTLTTNGVLLEDYLPQLCDAGLDGINISLDTLDRSKYTRVTGWDELPRVISSFNAATETNIPTKINCVPMMGINDTELVELASLAKDKADAVRFIELMPIGFSKPFKGLSLDDAIKAVESSFPGLEPFNERLGNGPAVYYQIPGFKGKIGFISAVSHKFCEECNRIRLTADGQLKLCLAHDIGADLRKILRDGSGDDKLEALIRDTVDKKPRQHSFGDKEAEDINSRDMYRIGG